MAELKPGTVVKTRSGNTRIIAHRKSESDSPRFGKAYRFTSGTWDHEAQFTVVSEPTPAPEKVKIPAHIAKAIENIRSARVESDEILFMDVMKDRMPAVDGDVRQDVYVLNHWAKDSVSNRKKYVQAITDGYRRELTPREKIVKAITDGEVSLDAAITVMDALGHMDTLIENIRKDVDADCVRGVDPIR